MKKFLFLAAVLSSLTFFTACENEDVTCQFHFMTSENVAVEQWTLYVDGVSLGVLTNPGEEPSCDGPAETMSSLIDATLDGSKHEFEALDASGAVRSKGYFKLTNTKGVLSSGRPGVGGAKMAGTCACAVVTVFD